jgi:hypothetical protein
MSGTNTVMTKKHLSAIRTAAKVRIASAATDAKAQKVHAKAQKKVLNALKKAVVAATVAKKQEAVAAKQAKKDAVEKKKAEAVAAKQAKKDEAEKKKAEAVAAAKNVAENVADVTVAMNDMVIADTVIADTENVSDITVAMDDMAISEEADAQRSEKPAKQSVAPIPWTGQANATLCQAIKTNHSLFTQCTKSPIAGEFCAACDKAFAKKGSHMNGTVTDRMAVAANDYVSPTGKKVVSYGKVLATMGISKEDAVAHLATQGIVLDDEQYIVPEKAKKGRKPSTKKRSDEDVEDDLASIVARAAKGVQEFKDATEDDDTESLVVDEWSFHGSTYLRDETTNKIYSAEFPYNQVGAYNPANGKLCPLV